MLTSPNPAPTESAVAVALRSFILGIVPSGTAIFSGAINGTTLTVTKVDPTRGPLAPGDSVLGIGVKSGTCIVQQLTGTAGGTGTYQVNISQTVAGQNAAPVRMSTGVEVIQAQINRVPEPLSEDYVLMTPLRS